MNMNSQFSFYPQQPDNPSDSDRYLLLHHALSQKGWAEDLNIIRRLMSPPPEITAYANPGEFKGVKVGVIGGGLAGLAAAFELRKLGFDITVYEALEDRIGGRIYTYYFDEQKALYHEFGAMRIPVAHETVWHYLKLFNLPTRPFIQFDANAYVYLKKTRVRNDPNGYNVRNYIYPRYDLKDWEYNTSWQNILYNGTDRHLLNASSEERSEILQVKPYYSRQT
jgi:monoamine oxidase